MPLLIILAILIIAGVSYMIENTNPHEAYTSEELEELTRRIVGKTRAETLEILRGGNNHEDQL